MNTAKKIVALAMFALTALGLFVSLPAFADGASDAALYCSGCHAGLSVNGVAVGGGQRVCLQRTVTEWTATIDRMNAKGCSVPAGSIAGIANYLAGLGGATLTCYSNIGTIFTTTASSCPVGSSSTRPDCRPLNFFIMGNTWFCEGTTTTSSSTSSSSSSTSSSTTTSSTTSTTAIGPTFTTAVDAANYYCSNCHSGLTVTGGVTIGAGLKICAQRSVTEWVATVDRMNAKGCGVPSNWVSGIASYLAQYIPPPLPITCYGDNGYVVTSYSGSCPTGTIATPPPMCNNGPAYLGTSGWVCPPPRFTCYNPDGTTFYSNSWTAPYCPAGTSTTPPPACNVGLPTFDGTTWSCFPTLVSSTTTTSTTTSSTPTTTLCNTYVNGTTQYKYSGSGSCHSFALDLVTGAHIVRDQQYCQKHMTHFNSSGNHVHAYPHPSCM